MNIFLKGLLLLMIVIPAAICWIFFFGKVYGVVAVAAYLLLMLFGIWFRRRQRVTEAEMLRRSDKAMGKPSDDPRQMAHWMP